MKQRRRAAQRNRTEYGFDYGIGITTMAVGSLEFNKNLVGAEVVAVAYGLEYSQKLGMTVPSITLVGRNEEPLRKAFEEFSDWAEATDADAIELTIVFMKSGGYRLCISPETGALFKRTLHSRNFEVGRYCRHRRIDFEVARQYFISCKFRWSSSLDDRSVVWQTCNYIRHSN